MSHLYVRELYGLLRTFGLNQDDVAEHLGCARTSVGGWIQGQRPIPPRHSTAFLHLVRQAIEKACATSSEQEHTLEILVRAHLERWATELSAAQRFDTRNYANCRSVLDVYLHHDPPHLETETLATMLAAARALVKTLRQETDRRRNPDALLATEHPPSGRQPVLAYFDALVAWSMLPSDANVPPGPRRPA